jgi:hypothetical protein
MNMDEDEKLAASTETLPLRTALTARATNAREARCGKNVLNTRELRAHQEEKAIRKG